MELGGLIQTASLVAGGVVFAVCYGAGWLAGRKDPAIARGDRGKWAAEPWHLRIRAGGR